MFNAIVLKGRLSELEWPGRAVALQPAGSVVEGIHDEIGIDAKTTAAEK